MPDGQRHSVTVPLLDFANPNVNRLYVTEELSVQRERAHGCFRPDIVLYANGIPLAVIEAKRPTSGERDMIAEGISQHLRNQKQDGISALYAYAQLLLSISGQDGRYGTTETPKKFWGLWREEEIAAAESERLCDEKLSEDQHRALFSDRPTVIRSHFDALWSSPVVATRQDAIIVSLIPRTAARIHPLLRALRPQGRQDRRPLPAGLRHQGAARPHP